MQTNCWSNRDPRHLYPYPVVPMWRQVLGLRKLRCSKFEQRIDGAYRYGISNLSLFPQLFICPGRSEARLLSPTPSHSVLKRFYVGSSIKEEASPVMVGLSREDSLLLRLFGWSWWRTGRGATKEGNDRV
ncbi:hypothetical protein WN943_002591 [Citrus x changshan-huyou]